MRRPACDAPEYLKDRDSHDFTTLLEWLNLQYVTSLGLQSGSAAEEWEGVSVEEFPERARPARVRIAAMQYLPRPIGRFEDFATQVEFFVRSAREYRGYFVVFPDYFTTHSLSYLREPSGAKAIRRLAQLTPEYEALFRRLASESGLYIVAGTHPLIQEGQLFNAAHLFTPNGRIFRQKRVHLTQTEKAWYQIGRGHGFYVYHTDFGKIAILVCYDVRIPQSGARAGRERSADSLRSLVH